MINQYNAYFRTFADKIVIIHTMPQTTTSNELFINDSL